jgi:integrase
MSPKKPQRARRTRETRRTLKPRKSSPAVCAERPDRAWAVSYRETRPDGSLAYARRFFPSKGEADAFCAEQRAAQASLGNLAGGLSDDIKREALLCLRQLAPYGKSLSDAVAYFVRDLEAQGASKTVADAIAALQADASSRDLSRRHRGMLGSILGRFSKAHGGELVASLRAEKVQAWLDGLRGKDGKPLGAVSFNTYRTYLASLFSLCVKREWARTNPVDRIAKRKVRARVPRLLAPGDLRQILAACDDALRPAVVLQAFCGLRVAEASRIEWGDILAGGYLQVQADKAKTARRRLVPIPAPALAYLVSARKPDGRVFASPQGGAGEDALQKALSDLRERVAAVAWGKNALRASALSYQLARSQNAAETALQMGNSPQVLMRDYRELATPEQAAEWFAIDPANPRARVLTMPRRKAGKRSAG